MSAAEFIAGIWHAVLARAETPDLRVEDLPSSFRQTIESAALTFYDSNAAAIDGASGIPGLNRPLAWQVGHEFGIVFCRQRAAARGADLGADLADRVTLAARAHDRVRLRMADGVATATVVDG